MSNSLQSLLIAYRAARIAMDMLWQKHDALLRELEEVGHEGGTVTV